MIPRSLALTALSLSHAWAAAPTDPTDSGRRETPLVMTADRALRIEHAGVTFRLDAAPPVPPGSLPPERLVPWHLIPLPLQATLLDSADPALRALADAARRAQLRLDQNDPPGAADAIAHLPSETLAHPGPTAAFLAHTRLAAALADADFPAAAAASVALGSRAPQLSPAVQAFLLPVVLTDAEARALRDALAAFPHTPAAEPYRTAAESFLDASPADATARPMPPLAAGLAAAAARARDPDPAVRRASVVALLRLADRDPEPAGALARRCLTAAADLADALNDPAAADTIRAARDARALAHQTGTTP